MFSSSSFVNFLYYRSHWLWDKVFSSIVRPPSVMNDDACIDYILQHHASLARFGDGELRIMSGLKINFQSADALLAKKLTEVSDITDSSFLIGIPDVFSHLERYCPPVARFWQEDLCYTRRNWYRIFSKRCVYANSLLSRFYSVDYDYDAATHRIAQLRKLWQGRNLLIIEGKDTKLGVGNDLFSGACRMRRILGPSENAFQSYDELLSSVLSFAEKSDLILLALGPTATCLAYDLFKNGFQALDLGHIDLEYEWYLQKASTKVPIIGKYSNEAKLEGRCKTEVTGAIEDAGYLDQVVCVVKSTIVADVMA